MKIFQKVRCKGYVKKFYDGVYIQFFYPDGKFCYDKTVTDYKAKAVAYKIVPESSEPAEIPNKGKRIFSEDITYCSNCRNEAYWDTDYGQQLFDYCPYCGARMEGEDDIS